MYEREENYEKWISEMKYDLTSVVKRQMEAVEWEFDEKDRLEKEKLQLQLPQIERENRESDAEIQGNIEDYEEDVEKYKKIHETPICLSECVLPQSVLVRFKKDVKDTRNYINGEGATDIKYDFVLLGEVAQASGHVAIISQLSGKVYTMIHVEDLEIVPPQEC